MPTKKAMATQCTHKLSIGLGAQKEMPLPD